MVDAHLEDVVRRLSDGRATTRKEALENLRTTLQQSRGSTRVDSLGDEGFHEIFEALFQCARIERSAYISSSRSSKSSPAENRLRDCASIFRLAIELGVRTITSKTATAVVDHVVDTLPANEDGYCTPLVDEYHKILRIILSHAPHVEHLRLRKWGSVVDFLLQAISYSVLNGNTSSADVTSSTNSELSRNGRMTSFRVSQNSTSRGSRQDPSRSGEDLMFCLDRLTTATNAPVSSKAGPLVACILLVFDGAAANAALLQTAFRCINNVLAVILTEDTALARSVSLQAISAIRRLWSSKNHLLRDEMLLTLLLSKGLIHGLPAHQVSEDLESSLWNLCDVISVEYSRRNEKDILQLDDLSFGKDCHQQVMSLGKFMVRAEQSRGTYNWATLSVLSSFTTALDSLSMHRHQGEAQETPSKRRKVVKMIDSILHQAVSDSSNLVRIRALQLLPFLQDHSSNIAVGFATMIGAFSIQILDEDPTIAAWTMIATASFVPAKLGASQESQSEWLQIWHSASRNLSNPSISRYSAHLLNVILRSNILPETDVPTLIENTFFSNGLNGPAGFSDAALSLWSTVLKPSSVNGQSISPRHAVRLINWFSSCYQLAIASDRAAFKQLAFHASTAALLNMFCVCTNAKVPSLNPNQTVISSPIFIAAHKQQRNVDLSNYLLRGELSVKEEEEEKDQGGSGTSHEEERTRNTENDNVLIEFLLTKLQAFQDSWLSMHQERASNINSDIAQIVATFVVISATLPEFIGIEQTSSCRELKRVSRQFWNLVCDFVRDSDDSQFSIAIAAAASLSVLQSPTSAQETVVSQILSAMASKLLLQLHKKGAATENGERHDLDMIDLDDSYASKTSQVGVLEPSNSEERHDLPFVTNYVCLKNLTRLSLHISLTADDASELDHQHGVPLLVDYVCGLSSEALLASRHVLVIHLSALDLSRSNLCKVLRSAAEACIQDYEFERCEASLCFFIEVMLISASTWVTEEEDELHETASEIYEWLITVLLGKSLGSSQVLVRLATLLQRVLSLNASYRNTTLPSSRTSLLDIMRTGSNSVKFHVAEKISSVFDRFVLTEHTAILDDVIESLPNNSSDPDGIALRLYVLAELAAHWTTLLRSSVYHLFETAAHVSAAIGHSKSCLGKVSSSIGLQSSRELFLLFASQLLFTWLEEGSIDSIPYSIFDFESLPQLVKAVQGELIGQIVMRSQNALADSLSIILKEPSEALLEASFAKTEAYSVARDISMPRAKDQPLRSAESQVRKQLGTDKYLRLVSRHFPEIVAHLFLSINNEHELTKTFAKRPEFAFAAAHLESMYGRSASKISLPPGQQPSFRAKYLLDELEFLCNRINKSLTTMWDAPLVVFVCRSLLDSMRPALGSLHACLTLRKIRVLVALAGPQAVKGYALNMLLHALQPYLTQFYCAEDALGIFWYLIDEGRAHLQHNPSMLCGMALSTVLSLTKFLALSPDSTTQESQYLSTINNAASFRSWFTGFLAEISIDDVSTEEAETFKRIIGFAKDFRSPGLADRESVQGKLLLELLEARTSRSKMLSQLAFEKALHLFCHPFVRPSCPSDDILGSDLSATRHAGVLWSSMNSIDASNNFWAWTGEVLGRAYAASGVIDPTLTKEHSDQYFQTSMTEGRTSVLASQFFVLRNLQDLLHDDDPVMVSSAEGTLRQILTILGRQKALLEYEDAIEVDLLGSLNWYPDECPTLDGSRESNLPLTDKKSSYHDASTANWASNLLVSFSTSVTAEPFLNALPRILLKQPSLAIQLMPSAVHIFLASDNRESRPNRQMVSEAFQEALLDKTETSLSRAKLVLNTLLYLRRQPVRKESTMEDRAKWLDIDLSIAAEAATSCSMYKTALLLLELQVSMLRTQSGRASKRSSVGQTEEITELFRSIYQNLDDPDSFYGMTEQASLESVVRQLDHEGDGRKSLSFQSALFDANQEDVSGVLNALVSANMNGVAMAVQSLATHGMGRRGNLWDQESLTAINLQRWSLPALTSSSSPASFPIQVFRFAQASTDLAETSHRLEASISDLVHVIAGGQVGRNALQESMGALAALTETRELLSSANLEELTTIWQALEAREEWQETENFERISLILSTREAFFSTLKKEPTLAEALRLSPSDCRLFEVKCLRHSLKQARGHGALQAALNRAIHLSALATESDVLGSHFGDVVAQDFAGVLWDHGNMTTSIQMLKQLNESPKHAKQSIPLSRPALLADMGSRIAEARLERPSEIINNYLLPAINALKGQSEGKETGRVYHEFASFCDLQTQNPDSIEEYDRVQKARQQRETEVKDLEKIAKKTQGRHKNDSANYLLKARQWYKLEDAEFRRLQRTRDNFLRSALENYLLSLRSCEDYPNDVLRFCAIWLDNSEDATANDAVSSYLEEVASRKFVPLMNQLSSRLLDNKDAFQESLFPLLKRICTDHPFHGMYQIFASSKNRGGRDDLAISRHTAANRLSDSLLQGRSGSIWVSIHNSSISFIRFATEILQDNDRHRSGSKVRLDKTSGGEKMIQAIKDMSTKIPPPTSKVAIRKDCDYSSVPTLYQFEPNFTVAGGISAPKIITMVASDGSRMKALLKGGNDDLRQDSIMEQVFEQVSNLLKDHRQARQRQLGIRTYKVLPLMTNAGIIEFVSNTTPLHDYSLPAHQKYYPRDWKPKKCRDEIALAEKRSQSDRVATFRRVCDNFQPVLRHFFLERYLDPDDWFGKRLAYSRSTAAISILGHVLGLGDRHGHNILLDEQTGEVVHIDLGIAFEAGRILPVPESVPFRLTRDIVDGMGHSGVEGVFRRCCNFTLEALRHDQYSIMTILDVLRYDPLYSWSLSPLRLQRMQENKKKQDELDAAGGGGGDADGADGGGGGGSATIPAAPAPVPAGGLKGKKDKEVNNPSEADRALTVVARKLGKSLSVEATVNELIQQAVDERNLAMLYCGWAAYA